MTDERKGKSSTSPLDDPLELAFLLAALQIEELILEKLAALLCLIDLVEDRLASLLDLTQALLEGAHASTHRAKLLVRCAARRLVAPEESGRAQVAELSQPVADLREQAIVLAFGRKPLELRVDGMQALHLPIELRASPRDFCLKFGFVLRSHLVHCRS